MGKKFLIYGVLHHQNVHHSHDAYLCPICSSLPPEQRDRHLSRDSVQKRMLELRIAECANQPGQVVVIQDFTKLDVQESSYQSLILVVHRSGTVHASCYHFVAGSQGFKNDIHFVVTCWLQLIRDGVFNHVRQLDIFSDGGPKHFKLSPTIFLVL